MTLTELKTIVSKRAKDCCEYCLLPQSMGFYPYQLDHIIPKQHGGADDLNNLAWCCPRCNRYKGPNLATLDPETGQLTSLFHPRKQRWPDHFTFVVGEIQGLSPEGRATVTLLRLNDEVRITERRLLYTQGLYIVKQ